MHIYTCTLILVPGHHITDLHVLNLMIMIIMVAATKATITTIATMTTDNTTATVGFGLKLSREHSL